MDQNAPLTTPEPAPVQETRKVTLAPIISLLTGFLAHILLTYSFFADMKVWAGALLGFLSALVAVIAGARAKRDAPKAVAGKIGRFLGWLYILGAVILTVLVILVLVGVIGGLGGLIQNLGL